jgi:transposase-like protein
MNESILKTDRIGRLRYTSEQKKTMVDAYRASGLSAPRFAAHHGLSYQTLISWIKKEKQSAASTSQNSPPFFSLIPAVIEDSGTSAAHEAMEISLPGGARLSITSESHVALAVALIRQLEQTRPC